MKRKSPPVIAQFTVAASAAGNEKFEYSILRAIGLLAFVEVITFHTALYGNTSVKVHPARSSPFLLVQYERSEGSPLAGAMRATTLYSVEST